MGLPIWQHLITENGWIDANRGVVAEIELDFVIGAGTSILLEAAARGIPSLEVDELRYKKNVNIEGARLIQLKPISKAQILQFINKSPTIAIRNEWMQFPGLDRRIKFE